MACVMLQVLEAPLEKKAGINYGPPGTKHLVYFVDDLNMPKLDPYETAMPISLIRQHLSWGHWFGKLLSLLLIAHWPVVAAGAVLTSTMLSCRSPKADAKEHQQHTVRGVHEPDCGQLCDQLSATAPVHDAGGGLPRPRQPDDYLRHLPAGRPTSWLQGTLCPDAWLEHIIVN